MLRQSRVFKVFVSSTFKDFQSERNALQEKVWPKLKALCESHECRFQAIDLRWGVPPEAGDARLTTRMCMEELKRCQDSSPRPNIIVLLGNRYGWRPLPEEIPSTEFLLLPADDAELLSQHYQLDENSIPSVWVRRRRATSDDSNAQTKLDNETAIAEDLIRKALAKIVQKLPQTRRIFYERSLTEQEITTGALGHKSGSAFAYIREIDEPSLNSMFQLQRTEIESFVDVVRHADGTLSTDTEAHLMLANLKQSVSEQFHITPDRCFRTRLLENGSLSESHIDDLCATVLSDLTTSILSEVDKLDNSTPVDREINSHEVWARNLTQHAIGREEEVKWIVARIKDNSEASTILVSGYAGLGKSTVMASAVAALRPYNSEMVVVQRFIGTTADSKNAMTLITGICAELAREIGVTWNNPGSRAEIVRSFRTMLGLATNDQRITIFLDGLDQLSHEDLGAIDWLPAEPPENVKFVLSVLSSESEEATSPLRVLRLRSTTELTIDSVSTDAAERLLDNLLGPNKRLTNDQREKVMTAYARCPRPLYLKIAASEAATWRSFYTDVALAGGDGDAGLAAIIGQLFDRLCAPQSHVSGLAERALSYLVADRSGPTEGELLDIVSLDNEFFSEFLRSSARTGQELPSCTNRIPDAVWARLMSDLRPHLVERSVYGLPRLAFHHRTLEFAAKTRFLTAANVSQRHIHLANCMKPRAGVGDKHALEELAWQFYAAKDYTSLSALARSNEFLRSQIFYLDRSDSPATQTMALAFELAIEQKDASGIVEFLLKPGRLRQYLPESTKANPLEILRSNGPNAAVVAATELSSQLALEWLMLIAWELSEGADPLQARLVLAQTLSLPPVRFSLDSIAWPFPPIGDDYPRDDRVGREWMATALTAVAKVGAELVLKVQKHLFEDNLRANLASQMAAAGYKEASVSLLSFAESTNGTIDIVCSLAEQGVDRESMLAKAESMLEESPSDWVLCRIALAQAKVGDEPGSIRALERISSRTPHGNPDAIVHFALPVFAALDRHIGEGRSDDELGKFFDRLLELAEADQAPEQFAYLEPHRSNFPIWSWIHCRLADKLIESNKLTSFERIGSQLPVGCLRERWRSRQVIHKASELQPLKDKDLAVLVPSAFELTHEGVRGEAICGIARFTEDRVLGQSLFDFGIALINEAPLPSKDLQGGEIVTRGFAQTIQFRRAASAHLTAAKDREMAVSLAYQTRSHEYSSIENRGGMGDGYFVDSRRAAYDWQFHAQIRDITVATDNPQSTKNWKQDIRYGEHQRWLSLRFARVSSARLENMIARDFLATTLLPPTTLPVAPSEDSKGLSTKIYRPGFELDDANLSRYDNLADRLFEWLRKPKITWRQSPQMKFVKSVLFEPWLTRPSSRLGVISMWAKRLFSLFAALTIPYSGFILVALLSSGNVFLIAIAFAFAVFFAWICRRVPTRAFEGELLRDRYGVLTGDRDFLDTINYVAKLRTKPVMSNEIASLLQMNEWWESHVSINHGPVPGMIVNPPKPTPEPVNATDTSLNDAVLLLAIAVCYHGSPKTAEPFIARCARQETYMRMDDNTIGLGLRSPDVPRPSVSRPLINRAIMALSDVYGKLGYVNDAIRTIELLLAEPDQVSLAEQAKWNCAQHCARRGDFRGVSYVLDAELRCYSGSETKFVYLSRRGIRPLTSLIPELCRSLADTGNQQQAVALAKHFELDFHSESIVAESNNEEHRNTNEEELVDEGGTEDASHDPLKLREAMSQILRQDLTSATAEDWAIAATYWLSLSPDTSELGLTRSQLFNSWRERIGNPFEVSADVERFPFGFPDKSYWKTPLQSRNVWLFRLLVGVKFGTGEFPDVMVLIQRVDTAFVRELFPILCAWIQSTEHLNALLTILEQADGDLGMLVDLVSARPGQSPELFRSALALMFRRWGNERKMLYRLTLALASLNDTGIADSLKQFFLALWREHDACEATDDFLSRATDDPERQNLIHLDLTESIGQLRNARERGNFGDDKDIGDLIRNGIDRVAEYQERGGEFNVSSETFGSYLLAQAEWEMRRGYWEGCIKSLEHSGQTSGFKALALFSRAYAEAFTVTGHTEHLVSWVESSLKTLKQIHEERRSFEISRSLDEIESTAQLELGRALIAAGLFEEASTATERLRESKIANATANEFWSQLFESRQNFKQASEQCDLQLESNPYSWITYCRRLQLQLRLNQTEESVLFALTTRLDLMPTVWAKLFIAIATVALVESGKSAHTIEDAEENLLVASPSFIEFDLSFLRDRIARLSGLAERVIVERRMNDVEQFIRAPRRLPLAPTNDSVRKTIRSLLPKTT
jgi:tetratricopeptide (TPR) repeat protein